MKYESDKKKRIAAEKKLLLDLLGDGKPHDFKSLVLKSGIPSVNVSSRLDYFRHHNIARCLRRTGVVRESNSIWQLESAFENSDTSLRSDFPSELYCQWGGYKIQ